MRMAISRSSADQGWCCPLNTLPELQSFLPCPSEVIPNIPNTIIISRFAYQQIQKCVEKAANHYETGGVLLGYRDADIFCIEAITADYGSRTGSKTSFVLNGEIHTRLAQKIINSSEKPLALLGVWHSHICDTAKFSKQDQYTNRTLATILNGALSLLVTWQDTFRETEIYGYFIAPDNSEYYQNIVIWEGKNMGSQNRCSNCVYWQYRKCIMTGQIKNDGICTCGQFKERK